MKLLIALLCLTLISCATPYQSRAGSFTGGYEIVNFDDLTFGVRASGNGLTSKKRIVDISLRASAEEAEKRGYQYFVILNRTSFSEGKTIIHSKPLTNDLIYTTVNETVMVIKEVDLQNVRGTYFTVASVLEKTKNL